MNRQRDYLGAKNCATNSKSGTSSGTSDYSTCSDSRTEYFYSKTENMQVSQPSVILAGQTLRNQQVLEDSEVINETNFSVNLLDQNLDVLSEDDVFMDCKDSSKSDSNANDTTEYLQLESMSNLLKIKSSNHFYNHYSNVNELQHNVETQTSRSSNLVPVATISQTEPDRLLTIMEETEVTINSIADRNTSPGNINKTGKLVVEMVDQFKNHDKLSKHDGNCTKTVVRSKSPVNINNTGQLVVEMVNQYKNYDKFSKHDGNCTKRVLFANEDNIMNDNQENRRIDKPILRREKTSKPLVGKDLCSARKEKDINENSNNHNHNTTESFVLWEKFVQSSEKITSSRKRSFSFSELNSVSESYGGDDEYSTSFKTLDDTYLSNCSFDTINDISSSPRKRFSRRSKSCDNLLKEVKHLPHILYDRFLKCLSKEIEIMRKQNVVCTCQRSDKKRLNKDDYERNSKHTTCKQTVLNKTDGKKETKRLLQVSPLKTVTNDLRLSPDALLKNSSENIQRLSPKSPNKTPTTPSKKRGLYCWQKEIVSPVGEYIKGKRQSPFKSSPSKKKV